MNMTVSFGEGLKVDVNTGDFVIPTDQAIHAGGNGTAPEPFAYFLASLASCAGIYVLSFCKQRGIPTDDIVIAQRPVFDPSTRMISDIHLEIQLPDHFPDQYRKAVVRSAEQCAVKKHLERPPRFHVGTTKVGNAPSDV